MNSSWQNIMASSDYSGFFERHKFSGLDWIWYDVYFTDQVTMSVFKILKRNSETKFDCPMLIPFPQKENAASWAADAFCFYVLVDVIEVKHWLGNIGMQWEIKLRLDSRDKMMSSYEW